MGVYIKDLKKPENCDVCPIFLVFTTCGLDRDHCMFQNVPESHGRLGDLDALMLKIREYIDEYGELDENGFHSEKWCAMKEAEMVICEAPTVIPASKEG